MNEVFADAYYWIALANPADQGHIAASEFNVTKPKLAIVTTEEVLTEFLNFYARAGQHRRRIVGTMCEQVLCHPDILVVPASHTSFKRGLELFRKREDKGYSLTDCISMSLCRERDIHAILTNDRHFQQEKLTILF